MQIIINETAKVSRFANKAAEGKGQISEIIDIKTIYYVSRDVPIKIFYEMILMKLERIS